MKNIVAQFKPQTVVGWGVGWLAAVVLNLLLEQKMDWKFWVGLKAVLLIRMATDFLYAYYDAKKSA